MISKSEKGLLSTVSVFSRCYLLLLTRQSLMAAVAIDQIHGFVNLGIISQRTARVSHHCSTLCILHTLLCSSECLLYEWHGTQNVLPSEKFVILSTEIGSSSLRGNLPPFCLRLTITTRVYSDISTPLPFKASHSRWHCNYITISCIPWSSLRGRAHFSPNITPSFLPIRQSFEKHNK